MNGHNKPADARARPPVPGRYTLHLDFLADDDLRCIHQAATYTQALNHLRAEVKTLTAQVSPAGAWTATIEVFCNAPGPDPTDVCTDLTGHPGCHHGPGPTRGWTDADIPTAPDTTGGIT